MSPLVIDRDALRALRAYAETAPIPLEEVRRIHAGEAPPAGERPGYALVLPVGYRVVYSLEEMPSRSGGAAWYRRMSVSGPRPGRLPHPAALEELARALGMPPLRDCWVTMDPAGLAVGVASACDPPGAAP
jgi:hypothetical protein